MELLFQFHSRSRGIPTSMESWCAFLVLVCLATGWIPAGTAAEVQSLRFENQDDRLPDNSSYPSASNLTDLTGPKPDLDYSSLKSQLDVFHPQKLDLFLRENSSKVSQECGNSLLTYVKGLKESQLWALKMLDSSGSYSSNFFYGNDYWFGSQTACLDLLHRSANDSPPFVVSYFSAKYEVNVNVSSHRREYSLTIGLCLPKDCSNGDLMTVLTSTTASSASLKRIRTVPDAEYNFYEEPVGIVLLAITVVTVLLVITGTLYEIHTMKRKRSVDFEQAQRNKEIGQNKSNSLKVSTVERLKFYVNHSIEVGEANGPNIHGAESTNSINSSTSSASVSSFDSTDQNPGIASQIMLCFSFKRNAKKIFNMKTTDSLACVHGLRVLSLLWVIAGHTCMITMPFVDNRQFRIIVERDFLFQSISNGAFSVDTFFFISGLLISYVYFKAESGKAKTPNETAGSHAKVSAMKFLGGVTYRIIRLSPPYLIVLVLSYLTGRWFYFNSVFDPPVGDHATCPQFWWRNVLYINTLFPVNQMCMIWSWYLADDTQFYFLGLAILLISSRYAKFAAISTTVLLVSSWATTAVITLYTQHKPSIEEPLGLFDQLYDKPWTRLGPYVVGMAVGFYLARINCKATYHKGAVAIGWILSMVTTFVLVHGLYGELDQVESAAYVALSHTAWSLAISWVIVACVTGYGGPVNVILSARMFAPLSRLSYCAYLIHPLIMLSALAHMDGATHLQRDTMIIAIFGYFLVSYLGSLVLTLLFEAPAVALLNIFHPIKKKMK